MTSIAPSQSPELEEAVAQRAAVLFGEHQTSLHRRTDRLFAYLLLGEWAFAIVLALVLSPHAWDGKVRTIHVHVPIAVLLGGVLTMLPVFLAFTRPGMPSTRYIIAVSQMLWSGLLIHLTGGRIETHFHVFGSLAFLSFYRDWRVLVPATLVVVVDHLVRQVVWPESAYGTTTPGAWRVLEHGAWVLFEDAFLVVACLSSRAEMRASAERQAQVETLSHLEEAKSAALDSALRELRSSQTAQIRAERLAALGKLAASMGHELRNPLAAVRNANAYVLKRLQAARPAPDSKVTQFLDVIDKEVGVCAKIISDLLDFAREKEPTRAPCPLRAVVDDAFSVVPNDAVVLENAVPEDLPILDLDRDQMRQVFVNLVQNAVEAMPADRRASGRVVVSGRARPAGGCIVEVRDNAGGIPADVAARIFEPLFTTKAKGTGLGLAVVASMVERHGGNIYLDSRLGEGTCFAIELPVDTLPPQQPQQVLEQTT